MSYRSVFQSGLFDGELHVVTGGGSGIGRCAAHELSSLGARVALVGRSREKLERVQAEIGDAGGEASIHPLDIREEDGVREVVSAIVSEHGRIHGLVNNAGGQYPSPLSAISKKGFEAVVRTNLVGGFLMARECFNQSMQAEGGSIVNIVADMHNGMVGMGHSGASRAGMVNLTKTAAVEWAPYGVRVNSIAPGWIASSGLDRYDESIKSVLRRLHEAVPMKRLGTESEISAAIVFLLSRASSFTSGICLNVDGAAPLASLVWTTPDHDRAPSFDAFHLSEKPKVLRDE
ncbi:MAG: SDR family oxidoreductase [Myxococcota bacterium]